MKYKWHKDNVPNPDKSRWDKANADWYDKRNKQLYADKQVKSYTELSGLYGLSIVRLQQIVKSQRGKFYERQE